MAIFTALVTATKVLASQGVKKAAVSGAKGLVKKKAKNFITGKGKKKKVSAIEKRSRGRGGYSSKPGAIVKTESSGVTPFIEGVSKSSDTSSKQETKTESVSFESIAKQLTGIVTLTNTLDSIVKSQYKTQKENTKQARTAAEKEKKREREEGKESKGSGIMSGIGGAIGAAGQKSGIFNYLTNILLGSVALGLLNNIGTLTSAFEFLKDNWSGVIGGIKTFALTFVNAKPALVKAFSAVKQFTGKGFKVIKSGFSKVGSSFVKLFRKLGVLVPKYIKNSITSANKGIRAAVEAGRRLPEAAREFLTFDKRGKSLGKTGTGLSKLLGTAGTGGAGAASNLGIGEGFRKLPGSSGRTNMYTLSKKARDIRAKHGNAAAEMYQQAINNGATQKRAMLNVRKALKPGGKLTSAPMAGRMRGGIGGSQLVKGGIQKTSKRALIKFVGKGGAKVVLKTLSRIPIIGPLIVGVASFLETGKIDQALFRAGGALIGGFLGTFIPIPVLGTLMGELIGEYVGDLFYTLIRGGGVEALGQKLQDDLKGVLSAGKKVAEWVGGGLQRFYEGIPKWKIGIPWIGKEFEVPDMVWWANPFNLVDKAKIFGEAFFGDRGMQDGKVKEREPDMDPGLKKRIEDAEQRDATIPYMPEGPLRDMAESLREKDIQDGLIPDPDFGLKGPDGKPLNFKKGAPSSEASGRTGGSSNGKFGQISSGYGDTDGQDTGVDIELYGPDGKISKKYGNNSKQGPYGGRGVPISFPYELTYNERIPGGRNAGAQSITYQGTTNRVVKGQGPSGFGHIGSYTYTDENGNRFEIMMGHGDRPFNKFSEGAKIPPGTVLGYQGATGSSDDGAGGLYDHITFHVNAMDGGSANKVIRQFTNSLISGKGTSIQQKPKPTKVAPTPTETKIPGITPPQKKDDAFVLKDANGNPLADIGKPKSDTEVKPPSSEVPPPAPVLPPPPQMTPQSSPSVGGIETYDEPQQGSTSVIPIPQQSAPSGGGGGGGSPMSMPGPSMGSLLNSYYKQQLLGFLYKQG